MPPRRKRKKQPFPLLLFIGGGIALLILAFLLANQNAATPTQTVAGDIPYPEIQRVSLADARVALESGTAILLDVRSADAFAGQHIAGAVNIPVAEIQIRLSELDPNAWIIPYCT
ncbi:MAG: rhodanese-like domain-containing protein [Anaerolineales bacterium]|nr:MAG: rhodanese-like domain-containing protein [Anaerolineales bacterium]